MKPLVIIGGGEHGRVVIDAARSQGWQIAGFVDPDPSPETQQRMNVAWLGPDDELLRTGPGERTFVLGLAGLGTAQRRREIVTRFTSASVAWATVVHGRAWVSSTARLADGVVVLAGAVVNTGATLGAHAVINSGAIVEHDVHLGAFSHVAPGAAIGGGARIGNDSYIGLGSRIRDHVELGARVTIGMGAVVTASAPDDAQLIGVPARPRR